jgi:hypothetical protein
MQVRSVGSRRGKIGGSKANRSVRRSSPRVEALEGRVVLSFGGGFTNAGLLGQYFANTSLSGTPAFSRRDVRVDFDWGNGATGGSTSSGFRDVGADDFSVRWTGQVVPALSETYTFTTTSDDGVRLYIKPTDTANWTTLVDHWNDHSPTQDSGSIALTEGQAYDIKLEYYQNQGGAVIQLAWSSPSTPQEVIDPLSTAGINAETYTRSVFANAIKTGRDEWGDANYDGKQAVPVDSNGWPMSDATKIVWEGKDPQSVAGTYLLQFSGKADVYIFFNVGHFSVGGVSYGNTLPSGTGYDSATNTTTAQVQIDPFSILYLSFRNSQRTATSQTNTGVTDVKLMRPTSPGATTYYSPDTLFTDGIKQAFSHFTTERWLTANFDVDQKEWTDRVLPSYDVAISGARDETWEYLVMMANETGKDLYITVPMNASQDYVTKLANLIRYGSDGVNPYTGPQDNPAYPSLNPNLRVYVEWSNEIWNWGFSQAGAGYNDALNAVHNNTPEGQIINFDGARPDGDFRCWTALKTVEASNIFRSVFGDAAMGNRVRMLLEYQYDNYQDTAAESLKFIDNYFNNGDGQQHVATPHPVNYYIWGAGGALYYDATNSTGSQSTVNFSDASFETATVSPGTAAVAPAGTPWTFTGNAGIYHNPTSGATAPIGDLGTPPLAPDGSQAAFIRDTGTISQAVNFPSTGVYALQITAASKNGSENAFRIFVDGIEATPMGTNDYRVTSTPWTPNSNTWGVDSHAYNTAVSAPFQISTPGPHTIRIVGTGANGTYTYIDDVKLNSLDAIFDSGIPGSNLVNVQGQSALANYQAQLDSQAKYAEAYGLHVVAYEGGWSLGGDSGGSTLQNYAKYVDPRAVQANLDSIDAFAKSGGALYVLGSYEQWPGRDNENAGSYPAVQAVDQAGGRLPVAPTNGVTVPGNLAVADRTWDYNDNNGTLSTNGWIAWNILVPTHGQYGVLMETGAGGSVQVSVDDSVVVATGASGQFLGGTATLSPGLHSIKVKALQGSFAVSGGSVVAPGIPFAPTNLSVTSNGDATRASLSWTDNATGEGGYRVERATDAGFTADLAQFDLPPGSTTYANSGLDPATTYYYRVRALGASGASDPSNTAVLMGPRPAGAASGLRYAYYEGGWSQLPDFSTMTPVKTGTVSSFDLSVRDSDTQYAVVYSGYVSVPTSGQYTFWTTSDDGSALWIDGAMVVNNDGVHPAIDASGTVGLAAGPHAIRVAFFQAGGGQTLVVSYSGPGFSRTAIPDAALYQPADPSNTAVVNLEGSFNRTGIVSDGSTFSGGLDGGGCALSTTLLGTNQTWNGTPFTIGAPGSSNVVSATGQTISLPAGHYASLQLLAVAVNGNQANQTFTVTYSDGTTATFTRSISDWYTPQDYPGESKAVAMGYRDINNGTTDSRTFYVYGYSFALDATKTIKSITLPNEGKVNILAIDMVS